MAKRLRAPAALILMVAGCGGDDSSAVDGGDIPDAASIDAVSYDAAPPDAPSCPALAFGAPGGPCNNDIDCGANSFCVDEEEGWSAVGYCTKLCSTGADCAAGSSCRTLTEEIPIGGGPAALCLPDCCAGDLCSSGQVCSDRFQGVYSLSGKACSPGVKSAADGVPCSGQHECRTDQFCLNDIDNPGGYCATIGCVVGDNSTCSPDGDGICLGNQVGQPGFCLDACTVPADCRQAEGYQCREVGALSVCAHPAVGEPCTQASDCGTTPWECFTNAPEQFPGGYCTVPGCDPTDTESCTDNSFCHDPDSVPGDGDEYCVRGCTDNTDCRQSYTCEDRGNGEPEGCFPS